MFSLQRVGKKTCQLAESAIRPLFLLKLNASFGPVEQRVCLNMRMSMFIFVNSDIGLCLHTSEV